MKQLSLVIVKVHSEYVIQYDSYSSHLFRVLLLSTSVLKAGAFNTQLGKLAATHYP
jgi:hypothetical protein